MSDHSPQYMTCDLDHSQYTHTHTTHTHTHTCPQSWGAWQTSSRGLGEMSNWGTWGDFNLGHDETADEGMGRKQTGA